MFLYYKQNTVYFIILFALLIKSVSKKSEQDLYGQ